MATVNERCEDEIVRHINNQLSETPILSMRVESILAHLTSWCGFSLKVARRALLHVLEINRPHVGYESVSIGLIEAMNMNGQRGLLRIQQRRTIGSNVVCLIFSRPIRTGRE